MRFSPPGTGAFHALLPSGAGGIGDLNNKALLVSTKISDALTSGVSPLRGRGHTGSQQLSLAGSDENSKNDLRESMT